MPVSLPFISALTLVLLALGVFIYWLIFLTEGVYLGEKAVVWLYDIYANRYDKIKDWVVQEEINYLAFPFAAEVGEHRSPPLILDVAAGTGRLPRAVRAAELLPDACWVLLDASAKMLAKAQEILGDDPNLHYLHHSAQTLPFEDDTFDVVACLEALEFMPDPEATLAELTRVLRPGGLLVITNRLGSITRLMPGKTWTHTDIYRQHKALGQKHVSIRPFLVDYEWVSSAKKGSFRSPGRADDPGVIAYLQALADLQYN